MSNLKLNIRQFIVDTFLFGQAGDLACESSFLVQGIIDSTGVLELVAYLENEYGMKIMDNELIPENLDSINAVAAFIAKKSTGTTPGTPLLLVDTGASRNSQALPETP